MPRRSPSKPLSNGPSSRGGPVELLDLSQIKEASYNPRYIGDDAARALRRSMTEFGDISGVTWNQRTGNLVSGHQRMAQLKKLYGEGLKLRRAGGKCWIEAPETPDPVNEGKTLPALEFPVRVVDFNLAKEKAANIAANNWRAQGEFVQEELNAILREIDTFDAFGDLLFDDLLDDDPADSHEADHPDDAEAAAASEDVPDEIFPSSNDHGVPDLRLDMQAEAVTTPVRMWGSLSKQADQPSTLHFYTDDWRFEPIWKDPRKPLKLEPVNIVEVNYSTSLNTPRAVVAYNVYRKRWMARWWQKLGFRIFVDVCASPAHLDLALLGVPQGWRAYATRLYAQMVDALDAQHAAAVERAGTRDIVMFAIGGGKAGKKRCHELGIVWLEEFRQGRWAAKAPASEATPHSARHASVDDDNFAEGL